MNESGRIVIPANVRRALGLVAGERLVLRLGEDGEIRLSTRAVGVERVRRRLAAALDGPSLATELIAERRAEAARE